MNSQVNSVIWKEFMENRLDYFLEFLQQCIIFFNIDGKIIKFNQNAKDFYLSQDMELNIGIYHYNCSLNKEIDIAIDNVIKNGVKHLQKHSIFETENSRRYIKWDVVPLKDKNEKIRGAIIIFDDITEIKKLRLQIQEQERKIIAGNLAAGFAHEIRNPLSVAGGAVQLLEMVDDTERQKKLIHKLRGEMDSINQILTDFLDIAKPHKKRELRSIRLPKIIEEIRFLIKSDANFNNINVIIHSSSDEFPLIKGDSTHLKQVFLNIMKNAIEAMEDGGELEISYYNTSKSIGVVFKDNGPGIPKKDFSHIFESFYTTKAEGTGLGLYVSSELIKDMGGELKIESVVGKGTSVRVIFPL